MVIDSAKKSVRTAVENTVAEEAVGRRRSGTGDRRCERGHRTAAGCVASVEKASSASAEGRGRGSLACRPNEATQRPRKSFGSVDVAAQKGCEDALRVLLRRTALGDVCRGQWMTREGRRFPWIHVAAERRLRMLFADGAAQG